MGTSFDCHIHVHAQPWTGLLIMAVGPFEMGNLAELLQWMSTEEFRDGMFTAASRAMTMYQQDTP